MNDVLFFKDSLMPDLPEDMDPETGPLLLNIIQICWLRNSLCTVLIMTAEMLLCWILCRIF